MTASRPTLVAILAAAFPGTALGLFAFAQPSWGIWAANLLWTLAAGLVLRQRQWQTNEVTSSLVFAAAFMPALASLFVWLDLLIY